MPLLEGHRPIRTLGGPNAMHAHSALCAPHHKTLWGSTHTSYLDAPTGAIAWPHRTCYNPTRTKGQIGYFKERTMNKKHLIVGIEGFIGRAAGMALTNDARFRAVVDQAIDWLDDRITPNSRLLEAISDLLLRKVFKELIEMLVQATFDRLKAQGKI